MSLIHTAFKKKPFSGNPLWLRTLHNIDGNHVPRDIAINSVNNSLYIVGDYYNNDAFVVKYSGAGTLAWQKRITSAEQDNGYAVAVGP